MKFRSLFILIFLLTALMLVQCASEAAPGGGPPDKTPPVLVDANIISGATKVPVDQELAFYFSENLNPDVIQKSVMIFPLKDDFATIRSRGRNIIVSPRGGWDPKVVYTLILGKNISDMRNNSLLEPYQFSFTPGDHMPENKITGKVLGAEDRSTAVICISRKYENPDSIILGPEYYTQTGPDGEFSFEHLPAEKFNITGYIDLDNSNSYKAIFDGICIPSSGSIIPDTSAKLILLQAVYENFLPGQTIKAESIQPNQTVLTYSKDLAILNGNNNFLLNSQPVDTLIFKKNACTIYHPAVNNDTLELEVSGLYDAVDMLIPDSTLYIPVTTWADSFFHFEKIGDLLRISPDPRTDILTGIYQTGADTTDITFTRILPGFYSTPSTKTKQQGTCLIDMPFLSERVHSDSTYSVPLELIPDPEYGAVLGTLDIKDYKDLHLVLEDTRNTYDIQVNDMSFKFDNVLPGSYALGYYLDDNRNGKRDLGRPYPLISPEFLHVLDTEIDVRARWDTELEEPYEIVIENDK